MSGYMWVLVIVISVFFFRQKTAYEMRISDWSSDVCSSDLGRGHNSVSHRCSWTARLQAAACHDQQQRDACAQPCSPAVVNRVKSHSLGSCERQLNLSRTIGRASCRERVCQYV